MMRAALVPQENSIVPDTPARTEVEAAESVAHVVLRIAD
jgi:hypothetical protein